MSAFTPSPVHIVRPGKIKTPSLTYIDGPETDIPGSPFIARFYRKKQSNFRGREEGKAGTSDVNNEQVLSIADPSAPIQEGDIAILPPGTAGIGEVRAKILRVRLYSTGLQCDIETGAV